MKYKKFIGIAGLLLLAMMMACDWNNHTEPDPKINNAEILGREAMYVNKTPLRPEGLTVLVVNESDTVDILMSTDLLNTPKYVYSPANGDVLKMITNTGDPMLARAVAVGDSGQTTTLTIRDDGNNAVKTINVLIHKHWADPASFTYFGSMAGHYYYLSNNLKGWAEAEEICEDAGGYLAVINSAEENDLLDVARGRIENVWIGLRFNMVDKWRLTTWVNGDSLDYENFNSKPSDPGIFAEYYFHMDVNGKWENWHEISYNYFLEME